MHAARGRGVYIEWFVHGTKIFWNGTSESETERQKTLFAGSQTVQKGEKELEEREAAES